MWLKIDARARRYYVHRALRIYHTEGNDGVISDSWREQLGQEGEDLLGHRRGQCVSTTAEAREAERVQAHYRPRMGGSPPETLRSQHPLSLWLPIARLEELHYHADTWSVEWAAQSQEGSMATDSSEGLAVLGYLAVMSRWKWLIIGITLACLAAGFGYLMTRTPHVQRDGTGCCTSSRSPSAIRSCRGAPDVPAARHRHDIRDGRERPGDQRRLQAARGKGHVGRLLRDGQPASGQQRQLQRDRGGHRSGLGESSDGRRRGQRHRPGVRRLAPRQPGDPGPGRSDGGRSGTEDVHDPDRQGERRVPAAQAVAASPRAAAAEPLQRLHHHRPGDRSDGALLASHEAHLGAWPASSAWHSGWDSPSCSSSSTPECATSGR